MKFSPLRPTGLEITFPAGAVAQLGERLICIQEVVGSIPISSTNRVQLQKHQSNASKTISLQCQNGPVAQLARAHP